MLKLRRRSEWFSLDLELSCFFLPHRPTTININSIVGSARHTIGFQHLSLSADMPSFISSRASTALCTNPSFLATLSISKPSHPVKQQAAVLVQAERRLGPVRGSDLRWLDGDGGRRRKMSCRKGFYNRRMLW